MGKIILTLSLLIVFNFALGAIVQCQNTPCSWKDLSNTLTNLVSQIVIISFWIAMAMTTIGAFLMMFHGPNPKLHEKGKEMIKIAIWGYILILLSGIIFDIILDFFKPKLKETTILDFFGFTYAQTEPTTYYKPLKEAVMSKLKCGKNASGPLDRLIKCIFEAIGLLRNLAVILLAFAIIISAGYLITTPLFGLKNIELAWKILKWSIIGLIVILLAEIIRDQILRLKQ